VIAPAAQARNWAADLAGTPSFYSASDLSLRVAQKRLARDWQPADQQFGIGVDFDHTGEEWPAALCGGLQLLTGSGKARSLTVTSSSLELDLGVRKIWYEFSKLWPYLGGGTATAYTAAKRTSAGHEDSDTTLSLGLWTGAGLYYRLGDRLTAGFDLRWSYLNTKLFGHEVDGGGWCAAVSLGYLWHDDKQY
jgi:opacity protein-like surface antigen